MPHGRAVLLPPLDQLTNVPAGTCCVMQWGPPPPCEIIAPGTPNVGWLYPDPVAADRGA